MKSSLPAARRFAAPFALAALLVALCTAATQAPAAAAAAAAADTEKSLYDRLGGIFALAAVVDHFSDALIQNLAKDWSL